MPDIVRILKENQTLKHVRLGYFSVRVFSVRVDKKSLKAIVTALQGNETLQTLKLFHNYTKEKVDSIMKKKMATFKVAVEHSVPIESREEMSAILNKMDSRAVYMESSAQLNAILHDYSNHFYL